MAYLDYLGLDNVKAAGNLLYTETFGAQQPYYKWAGALLIILAIGYIPEMEPVATGLITLVLLVMILKNKNGFAALFNIG